jgi:hypothetical protein
MRRRCRRCAGRTLSNRTMRPPMIENAHRTEKREVLYLFHPWARCIVHIHDVIKRPTGDVGRCSRHGRATDRCLELPMWMFDRAACAAIRVEAHPRAHIAALSALMALMRQVAAHGDGVHIALSNAPICGVRRIPHDPNRGDSNAISSRSSPGRSKRSETIRSLRPSDERQRRTGAAAVADAYRADAADGNKPFNSPDARPRKR